MAVLNSVFRRLGLKTLVMIIALSIMCGCKGGGGKGGGSSDNLEPENYKVKEEHLGLWARCFNDTDDGSSMLYIYSLSSNSLSSGYVYYSGLNCQTADIAYEEKFVNEVTRFGEKHLTSLEGASSRSMSASDVTYNNNNSYCGFTNWSLMVPKNILSRNCMGETNSAGDMGEFYLSKDGNSLIVKGENDPLELHPIHRPNFNHAGMPISNGSYAVLYDDISYLYVFNNGNYTIHAHNVKNTIYYQQAGTYTTSGNTVTFTMSSETPDCGTPNGESFTLYYSPNSVSTIFKNNKDDVMIAESITWTGTEFVDAYAGSSVNPGCL